MLRIVLKKSRGSTSSKSEHAPTHMFPFQRMDSKMYDHGFISAGKFLKTGQLFMMPCQNFGSALLLNSASQSWEPPGRFTGQILQTKKLWMKQKNLRLSKFLNLNDVFKLHDFSSQKILIRT